MRVPAQAGTNAGGQGLLVAAGPGAARGGAHLGGGLARTGAVTRKRRRRRRAQDLHDGGDEPRPDDALGTRRIANKDSISTAELNQRS